MTNRKQGPSDKRRVPVFVLRPASADTIRSYDRQIELAMPMGNPLLFGHGVIHPGLCLADHMNWKDVFCFKKYVVIRSTNPFLSIGDVLSFRELMRLRKKLGNTFDVDSGAKAIQQLFDQLSGTTLLRPDRKKYLRDLQAVGALPTSYLLTVLPVFSFANEESADIIANRYEIIARMNEQLMLMLLTNAPFSLVQHECQQLQLQIEELFDIITNMLDNPLENWLSHVGKKVKQSVQRRLSGANETIIRALGLELTSDAI